MPDEAPRGTRYLSIPDRASTAAEYEALREARQCGSGDLDAELVYSERTLVATARTVRESDLDAERVLTILAQPDPTFGIEPSEVYGEQLGEPSFPPAGVRIDLDAVRWLREFCDGATAIVYAGEPPVVEDRREGVLGFLSNLRAFCDTALELGIRPTMSRN